MTTTDRKYRHRFATGEKLTLFEHILLSSVLVNSRVIVIAKRQKIFQLQLQLQLDGSLPANPVNDRRIANAVTLESTFCLP